MQSLHAIGLALVLLVPLNTAEFIRLCGLEHVPIVAITKDQAGQYVFVNDRANVSNGPTSSPSSVNRRLLRQQENHPFEAALRVQQQSRSLQSNSSSIIYVRECICSYSDVKTYCPLDLDICGVRYQNKNSDVGSTGCFTESSKTFLIRNAWPIVVIWFVALVLFLLFTEQGRNARWFCWNRFCDPRMNDRIVERIIQPLSVQAAFWANRMRLAQQRHMANERMPHELALKTKVFHVHHDTSNTEEGEFTCTICFHALQEGDRVGALPCNHEFHVECLKGWLARRNVCPLCQAPDVAVPRYREPDYSQGVVHVTSETFLGPEITPSVNEIAQPTAGRRDNFRGRVVIRR